MVLIGCQPISVLFCAITWITLILASDGLGLHVYVFLGGTRCSNIEICCTCEWNTFESVHQSLHRLCSRMIFWTVIINIAGVNDVVNKHFMFYYMCFHLTASLAPILSFAINDCYSVLHKPMMFVLWILNHPVCITLYLCLPIHEVHLTNKLKTF